MIQRPKKWGSTPLVAGLIPYIGVGFKYQQDQKRFLSDHLKKVLNCARLCQFIEQFRGSFTAKIFGQNWTFLFQDDELTDFYKLTEADASVVEGNKRLFIRPLPHDFGTQ